MPTLLNNLLRRLREQSLPDESAASVAKNRLDIDKLYLSKIERGELSRPPKELLSQMLDVYGAAAPIREGVEYLYEEAKQSKLPSDVVDFDTIEQFFQKAALGAPRWFLLRDAVPVDLITAPPRADDTFAITFTAVMAEVERNAEFGSSEVLDPLFRRLIEDGRQVFMIDPRETYCTSRSDMLNSGPSQVSVGLLFLATLDRAMSLTDVTADVKRIRHFAEKFDRVYSLSLPGRLAVASIEAYIRARSAFQAELDTLLANQHTGMSSFIKFMRSFPEPPARPKKPKKKRPRERDE